MGRELWQREGDSALRARRVALPQPSSNMTLARLSPPRRGDHMQMMLSSNDMECVLGHEVMNGIEDIESRIRKECMAQIANGVDLLAWFRTFDVNRDGSITRGELLEGLLAMGVNLDDFLDASGELDGFMKKIDRGLMQHELDNKVDYQEFIKFIMSHGEFSYHDIDLGIHRPIDLILNRGKLIVGLLFGQHWNPSYMKVQKKVETFYNNLQKAGEKRFEVVYVSLDQSKMHFTDTYRHMPWLSIPFHQRERRHWLAQKFFVTSTPRMVLLDCHGNLLSYDVKNDCVDYCDKPWVAFNSWMQGEVREVAHGGVNFF